MLPMALASAGSRAFSATFQLFASAVPSTSNSVSSWPRSPASSENSTLLIMRTVGSVLASSRMATRSPW